MNQSGRVSLKTRRLVLLAPTQADLEAAARCPDRLPSLLGCVLPAPDDVAFYKNRTTIYKAKSRLIAQMPREWLLATAWQIVCDGVVVGEVGFKGPPLLGEIEIGYGLRAGQQKQGYMTEAVDALCRFAFTSDTRVSAVIAVTKWRNTASHNVLRRCGFTRSGFRGLYYLWRLRKTPRVGSDCPEK